jgi:protein ImuB
MIACALIPRLALVAALEHPGEMLGRPLALAPEPGGPQVVGETSSAAEAYGIRAGMPLAEALGRCPALVLVPPDPARAEAIREQVLHLLEAIGAAVEPGAESEAFFSLDPLQPLYRTSAEALRAARRALPERVRLAGAPARLPAYAAASRARARRPPPTLDERQARGLVARLPVAVLLQALTWPASSDKRERERWERLNLPETLERLGVRTLGELARLPADAVADRFGAPGLRALRLARGADVPLRPRRPPAELVEEIELPESALGPQLERALELLVDRLLAGPARRGRTVRRLRLEARLAAGGGWRTEVSLRSASADPERLRLALAPKLAGLPAPASTLSLRALDLGPAATEAPPLAASATERRRSRLAEASRQVRAAAGRDAILQVLEVDPGSRIPERRVALSPLLHHPHAARSKAAPPDSDGG